MFALPFRITLIRNHAECLLYFHFRPAGNQACVLAQREITPGPGKDNGEFAAEIDKRNDMHHTPDQPGEKPAEAVAADRGNRPVAADGGHSSLIAIDDGLAFTRLR